MYPFCHLRPFLGLKLLGRNDFAFLGYIVSLFIHFSFLVSLFRGGSVDRERSGRLGLDGYVRSKPSSV